MELKTRPFKSGEYYTLDDLFIGDRKIIVPDLQRDYCWGDKTHGPNNNAELVTDFVNSLVESFNREEEDLTLGLIYAYEHPANHFQLCDGQQRLTTLFLLIGMLNRRTNNLFMHKLISIFELEHDDKEPYLLYAIRESTLYFLGDLVNNFFLSKGVTAVKDIQHQEWYFAEYNIDPSIQSMLYALECIEQQTKEVNPNTLGRYLLHGLKFLYYDMGSRENGEETFVVINTTGEPLTATENLKPILLGNESYTRKRKEYSEEWEMRETFFWKNRDKENNELTADNGLNQFFVWYWQICLLQESDWSSGSKERLNPLKLFTKLPENRRTSPDTEEYHLTPTAWEEFKSLDKVDAYFQAYKFLVEEVSTDDRCRKVLKTIKKTDEFNGVYFRHLPISVLLPMMEYCYKFKIEDPADDLFYRFVRRLRKNYFDAEWDRAEHVDWRHIIQIIRQCTKDRVLTFQGSVGFKDIPHVRLNIWNWYSLEEQIKIELKVSNNDEVESMEDHKDLMGDLRPLLRMLSLSDENESIPEVNPALLGTVAFGSLHRVYQNYRRLANTLVEGKAQADVQLSNWYRLYRLFSGCNKIGHMARCSWEFEGVKFSVQNLNHFKKTSFYKLCSEQEDRLIPFMASYIQSKLTKDEISNIRQETFNLKTFIKSWMLIKVLKANKENVLLSFHDGRDTGVAAYLDVTRNKLFEDAEFSLGNSICGYGVKSGFGHGNVVSYTNSENWLKPHCIDTPFEGINYDDFMIKSLKDWTQLEANQLEVDQLINIFYN